jgi:hypothetical protein
VAPWDGQEVLRVVAVADTITLKLRGLEPGRQHRVSFEDGSNPTAEKTGWIYSAVWFWHLETLKTRRAWIPLPWYPQKTTPSFADALACLRRALWRERLFVNSEENPLPSKITATLINVLAMAA